MHDGAFLLPLITITRKMICSPNFHRRPLLSVSADFDLFRGSGFEHGEGARTEANARFTDLKFPLYCFIKLCMLLIVVFIVQNWQ